MLTVQQAASVLGALCTGAKDKVFSGVSTDSRRIKAGELFIALRGPTFDGHKFVEEALQKGAVAAIVDSHYSATAAEYPLIIVEDSIAALGKLAHYWRQQTAVTLLAITGSSGKTTVKEMLATILQQQFGAAVLATAGNLNNHIGLPLTLLRLQPSHQFAVVEMGMSGPGEIAYLSQLAKPDIALVNNAQGAHLEALGTVKGVAQAKAEIFSGLKSGGAAIINIDDPLHYIWQQAANHHRQYTFGLAEGFAHVSALQLAPLNSSFILHIAERQVDVKLALPGRHNVYNALAAAMMAASCGVGIEYIATGLAVSTQPKGRLTQRIMQNGGLLIDDSYNANPGSVKAAVDVLAQFRAPRVLILGDMGEMGQQAVSLHAQVGEYAKTSGIEVLLALGDNMALAARAFGGEHFSDIETLVSRARQIITADSTVLVKGSRFMQMERVVAALT